LPVKLLDLSLSHGTSSFFNTDSFFNTTNLNYKYLGSYSLSKKQLIEWLKLLSDKIQIVNLKLEHLYGPKDSNNKFVMWLINECIKNTPGLKLTEGNQKRDFIYVSDAVNAFLLTLKKRKLLSNYSEFEVGTGEGIDIRDFAVNVKNAVSEVSGKEVNTFLDFGAIPYTEGEIMESKADSSALRQLGWKYSVNLKDGLEKTIKGILNL
jgi:nucleoside-diphosphate-sugar epimerase